MFFGISAGFWTFGWFGFGISLHGAYVLNVLFSFFLSSEKRRCLPFARSEVAPIIPIRSTSSLTSMFDAYSLAGNRCAIVKPLTWI